MGRPLRAASADVMYHVINRANARRTLFDDDGDYAAFERVLAQAWGEKKVSGCLPVIDAGTLAERDVLDS